VSDKSSSLTSLSAHTEQKKHRVRSKTGNNQQQDTKKHKTDTIEGLSQYNELSTLKNAISARCELPRDQISSFYGLHLLTVVHAVSDLPHTC